MDPACGCDRGATPRQVLDRPLTMLAGAGLTDAGENVPLAILMRVGGNWREPSVLPAASSFALRLMSVSAHLITASFVTVAGEGVGTEAHTAVPQRPRLDRCVSQTLPKFNSG